MHQLQKHLIQYGFCSYFNLGCNYEYDIVFAIDASGSIRNNRFPDVKELAASVVDAFEFDSDRNRARFGALTFSDNSDIRFQLNS